MNFTRLTGNRWVFFTHLILNQPIPAALPQLDGSILSLPAQVKFPFPPVTVKHHLSFGMGFHRPKLKDGFLHLLSTIRLDGKNTVMLFHHWLV